VAGTETAIGTAVASAFRVSPFGVFAVLEVAAVAGFVSAFAFAGFGGSALAFAAARFSCCLKLARLEAGFGFASEPRSGWAFAWGLPRAGLLVPDASELVGADARLAASGSLWAREAAIHPRSAPVTDAEARPIFQARIVLLSQPTAAARNRAQTALRKR